MGVGHMWTQPRTPAYVGVAVTLTDEVPVREGDTVGVGEISDDVATVKVNPVETDVPSDVHCVRADSSGPGHDVVGFSQRGYRVRLHIRPPPRKPQAALSVPVPVPRHVSEQQCPAKLRSAVDRPSQSRSVGWWVVGEGGGGGAMARNSSTARIAPSETCFGRWS